MFEAKEIVFENKDWISLVFLTILIVLVIVKIMFKDRLANTNILFFSKKYVSIYFNKEKTNLFNLFQTGMFVVQILVLSLLFYTISIYFNLNVEILNLNRFLIILIAVSSYFIIRYGIGVFLAQIFDVLKIHKKIVYQKISYFNNLILWILPFVFFLIYFPYSKTLLFKITLISFVFFVIIRYVLLLVNNKNLIFRNLFYFILYLCALEIAPLLIILKLTI